MSDDDLKKVTGCLCLRFFKNVCPGDIFFPRALALKQLTDVVLILTCIRSKPRKVRFMKTQLSRFPVKEVLQVRGPDLSFKKRSLRVVLNRLEIRILCKHAKLWSNIVLEDKKILNLIQLRGVALFCKHEMKENAALWC
ncbi:hypothetical protein CEXT_815381 [Caerostris extrusa]|uniref:Uncharacterized protein n=1 Tax=Caerostris extrusa TaxID=172846 RepID=A0AAV4MZJ8_CAEEX|nr:hypothetical protein CEXT_815381 [Caerostris extrusa]